MLVWDILLYSLIGLTVAISVLSVGPLIAFGFLLIPPLVARQFARNMGQFVVIASLIGGVTALTGFCVAYRLDLPVGPADVMLLGGALCAGVCGEARPDPMGRTAASSGGGRRSFRVVVSDNAFPIAFLALAGQTCHLEPLLAAKARRGYE